MTAKTKEISAVSRISVKIKDSFYTVEYGETRSLEPTDDEEILSFEREELWKTVHGEVDKQVEEIVDTFGR